MDEQKDIAKLWFMSDDQNDSSFGETDLLADVPSVDSFLEEPTNDSPSVALKRVPFSSSSQAKSSISVKKQETKKSKFPNGLFNKKNNKPKKKRGWLATTVWLLCLFAISVGLCSVAVVAFCDYAGVGKDFFRGRETTSVQIYVEEGASVREIATQLKEQDVLMNRTFFLAYLKLTGQGGDMSYGTHGFHTDMSYDQIVRSLAQPAKRKSVTITIPSGKSTDQILKMIADEKICSYDDLKHELLHGTFESSLWKAIPKNSAMEYAMEGYLFPDTYEFYVNDDPHQVIQKMLDNLEERFTPAMRQMAKERGYTPHEILTMASVVEMESCGYFSEMPRVAAVFYNRIDDPAQTGGYLQSDPTMEYPYGDGAYNTYKVRGLPPGPMCTVTEAAIHAAVSPDSTVTAHFFVTDAEFRFYYSDTLAEHDRVIANLKEQGLWLADLQSE
jgi:UPF0755 protein